MRSPIKLAQAMLGASGADVRQDGVLDEQTVAAYEGTTPAVREVVRESVQRWEGVDLDRVVMNYRRSRKKGTSTRGLVATVPRSTQTSVRKPATFVLERRKFISTDDALALARKYDSLASLPGGTLELMLSHEAVRVPGGFDPSGVGGAGGKYHGLYQFHRDASLAWADGTRWARTFGVTIPPMHPNAWADPEMNTACAAGYAAMNSRDRKSVV